MRTPLIPLGDGRALNPPMALGRLLTEAQADRRRARARDRRRHRLCGGGARPAGRLGGRARGEYGARRDRARSALEGSGVTLVEGPLAAGHAAAAPYDLVLIDGAVEQLPDAIIDQVADGGRIATGLLEQGVTRLAVGRVIGGAIGFITFADAAIAPLPGFSAPRGFSF